jgi:hypothetical protein
MNPAVIGGIAVVAFSFLLVVILVVYFATQNNSSIGSNDNNASAKAAAASAKAAAKAKAADLASFKNNKIKFNVNTEETTSLFRLQTEANNAYCLDSTKLQVKDPTTNLYGVSQCDSNNKNQVFQTKYDNPSTFRSLYNIGGEVNIETNYGVDSVLANKNLYYGNSQFWKPGDNTASIVSIAGWGQAKYKSIDVSKPSNLGDKNNTSEYQAWYVKTDSTVPYNSWSYGLPSGWYNIAVSGSTKQCGDGSSGVWCNQDPKNVPNPFYINNILDGTYTIQSAIGGDQNATNNYCNNNTSTGNAIGCGHTSDTTTPSTASTTRFKITNIAADGYQYYIQAANTGNYCTCITASSNVLNCVQTTKATSQSIFTILPASYTIYTAAQVAKLADSA